MADPQEGRWRSRILAKLPDPVASAARRAWGRLKAAPYRLQYGFWPPPIWTDLVGYESLIKIIEERKLLAIPGDFVEVGAFCGGGTYKLSRFLLRERSEKRLFAIDCFDIHADHSECTAGERMGDMYSRMLEGKSQEEVFRQVTQGLTNLVVMATDSKKASLPTNAVAFGFVDGNHSPDYVESDFYLVWEKLSPGGVVAFHDYGHDLPEVTAKLDELCAKHRSEILESFVLDEKHILGIRKQ